MIPFLHDREHKIVAVALLAVTTSGVFLLIQSQLSGDRYDPISEYQRDPIVTYFHEQYDNDGMRIERHKNGHIVKITSEVVNDRYAELQINSTMYPIVEYRCYDISGGYKDMMFDLDLVSTGMMIQFPCYEWDFR